MEQHFKKVGARSYTAPSKKKVRRPSPPPPRPSRFRRLWSYSVSCACYSDVRHP